MMARIMLSATCVVALLAVTAPVTAACGGVPFARATRVSWLVSWRAEHSKAEEWESQKRVNARLQAFHDLPHARFAL